MFFTQRGGGGGGLAQRGGGGDLMHHLPDSSDVEQLQPSNSPTPSCALSFQYSLDGNTIIHLQITLANHVQSNSALVLVHESRELKIMVLFFC